MFVNKAKVLIYKTLPYVGNEPAVCLPGSKQIQRHFLNSSFGLRGDNLNDRNSTHTHKKNCLYFKGIISVSVIAPSLLHVWNKSTDVKMSFMYFESPSAHDNLFLKNVFT